MTAMEVLNLYRRTVTEIDELQRQLEHVSPSGRPSGVRGAGSRNEGPSTNNGMAAAMQLADGLSDLIRRKKEVLAGLSARVFEMLGGISDGREYQIVQQYYLMGETDESVARSLGLSTTRVNQIRRDFLKEMRIRESLQGLVMNA